MKLYSRPLSPYSSVIRCIAYYKNAPVKVVAPPAGNPIPEEFRAVSPFKRIPVLVTGSGLTIIEAPVIAEYLEEHFPEPAILPADSRDRAVVRMVARIAEQEVLVPVMQLFELLYFKSSDAKQISALYERMERGLAELEDRIGHGVFAHGDQLTLADAWLTPIRFVFNNFRQLSGRSDLLEPYPNFDAYEQRILQDPVLSVVWYEMTDGLKVFMKPLESA
ncbi:glutathione S-transferase family protein [Phyllobacterium sp. 0TCS1.6C]|uniref:glutathione S-transferase family protein n=1 Tax=unclassified Phyllobacterium TaxID=2638441 RepID=UPI002263D400|nr:MULTISPECIES: glutathione S-transferase family protein [unclassified Phyllobacterium]MCX8280542.1 glutathione S-transferase family protein [Phyllobacterium sp. 0TCS1.6C]MCX8295009.1 glutathione S-transferase family protein [Phyllobacterium sp. 0TCS1.6A]